MIQLGTIVLAQMIAVSSVGAGLPQLGSDVRVVDLRCEYMADPLGVDVAQPRLSWKLESRWRGQKQTAYQILVAASEKMLKDDRADLWDSGKVASDQSVHVVYPARPLASRTRCYWKVRVWDADGKTSPFSEVGTWDMGLLTPEDWKAKWISVPGKDEDKAPQAAPLFRKSFILAEPPVSARVYICGLGYHELRLNGEKVGDHVLDPAFTRYDRRSLYVVHDVTNQLKKGSQRPRRDPRQRLVQHAHPLRVGFRQGPLAGPAGPAVPARDDVRRRLDEGRRQRRDVAGLDRPDRLRQHPQRRDLRRPPGEGPAGTRPDYDDINWSLAQVDSGPKGELRSQMMPPIKVTQTLKSAKLTEPKPGVFVFDIGQNMAGWARLKVSGPAGTEVVMRYGERLNADGTLDQQEIGQHVKTGKAPDRHLHPQGPGHGGLGAAIRLSRLPVRRSDRPAGQAEPGHAGGPRRAHRVRQGRLVRVLQRAVQPDSAQHAVVVREQLRRLSDRLPAPREERLDGRRAPGRRDRAVQLRFGHRRMPSG